MRKVSLVVSLGLVLATTVALPAVASHKYIACAPFECPYFQIWLDGAKAAADDLGVKLTTATAGWDPSREATLIEGAVAGGADGVIVARVDLDAFVSWAKRVANFGVPIVTTDGPFHQGPRLAHFWADDVDMGRILAREMLKVLENSGKPKPWRLVVFAGLPGTYSGTLRPDGAMAILRPYIDSGDVVVTYEIANFARELAMKKMQAILAKGPVDGVIAANDDMAIGALKACEAAGLNPGTDVFFVGIDIIPEAAKLIEGGKYLGSVTQAPWLEGYWGVATIYFYQEYGCKPDAPSMPVPYFFVDSENLDSFEQYIKYNGPPPPEFFTNCADEYKAFVDEHWPGFSWPEWPKQ